MTTAIFFLTLIIVVALIFEYTNGFQDAANAIATVVSTKVLSPRQAILYAAVLNFIGAFFGTAVAKTVGSGIVDKLAITPEVILCGLLGAIFMTVLTWFFGIPISCSHALIGGLVGAAVAGSGFSVVHVDTLVTKVVVPMFASPLMGFIVGFLFMLILLWIVAKMAPEKINKKFKALQVVSAGIMAFSHGSNDAQKTMGIITLALLTYWMTTLGHPGPDDFIVKVVPVANSVTINLNDFVEGDDSFTKFEKGVAYVLATKADENDTITVEFTYNNGTFRFLTDSVESDGSTVTFSDPRLRTGEEYSFTLHSYEFVVPFWVIFICALTMMLGTAAGGWKIIRTLGHRVLKLKPIHGFAAETTAAGTILTATFFGIPVSTTHIISTAIMGVGSTIRLSAVKWGIVGKIVTAWFLTIPLSATVAAILYKMFVW